MNQYEHLIKYKKLEVINTAIQMNLKVGGVVAICAIFASALKALSGRQALLSMTLLLVANLKLSEKISFVLGFGGALYGYRQRRLRGTVIEMMSEHQRKLEQTPDPRRSSSEITPKGTTRPDDRSLE
ncbi:MAG TPA: hypothetical protein VG028_18445 [Terriglobia bacterium]|nr:hypothetical protein [Terriglobia bacterium]